MDGEVKLSELESVLSELSYPVTRQAVIDRVGDVTLLYADGEERLGDVVGRANDDEFESMDELSSEVYNNLPTRAVGEPGQSEGEG